MHGDLSPNLKCIYRPVEMEEKGEWLERQVSSGGLLGIMRRIVFVFRKKG